MKVDKLAQLLENDKKIPPKPRLRKIKMSKTFETITPESAEHGDFDDNGFEYQDEIFDDIYDIATEIKSESAYDQGGDWYQTDFFTSDYSTGEEMSYSFHPELKKGEKDYLDYLMKLKNSDVINIRDQHREDEKLGGKLPITTKPKVEID